MSSGASSATQIAGLVQWRPGRRAVSPYLAGGILWRRVVLLAGPTDQTDAELGLLGVAGGAARISVQRDVVEDGQLPHVLAPG